MERWTGEAGRPAPGRPLTCAAEGGYPTAVVHLSGCLDAGGAARVHACVMDCLALEPSLVIVDVADLTVADDDGLAVFAELARQSVTWPGSTLVFAEAPPALVAAVRRQGAQIASYPTVAAARQVDAGPPWYRLHETLPASPVAAPAARQLLGRACRSWSVVELLEPAEVVTTELVANAVRHACGEVQLTVSLHHGQLQISVGDDSPVPPHPQAAAPCDEHGRGLQMVEALSTDWGTTCLGDGKVVWAKVAAGPL
jgi:anti-sigma regulatory factor (Ser/Thr protein kinase)